ncbi:type III PLP-dependent enzyme [Candidatus Solincola sp.]|nr:type III PLP-dependent enzyme [Actinomycetota bacterium]
MRELAKAFFRVYGRFPSSDGHSHRKFLIKAGYDGSSYPQPLVLEGCSNALAEVPWNYSRGTLHYRGHDSFMTIGPADHVLISEVKRKYAFARTPFLVFDISRVMDNYLLFRRLLNGAEIFYPVKCNDHPLLLGLLRDWDSGFEAASWAEIRSLLAMGVEPDRIIFGAPIKAEEHIASAWRAGVKIYAFDSREEVEKLARSAPGARVYLRISVPDLGASVFPLSGKFGAPLHDAHRLLWFARRKGLRPVGLSFHVGSQCLDPSAWWLAVAAAARVWEGAAKQGMKLEFLNLGGGIPVSYRLPVPDKEVFISHINLALRGHFQKPPRVLVEPGRAMVGDAAVMVATVIGKAHRQGMDWVYIDAGTYQGLVEAVQEKERFSYQVYAEGKGPLRRYNVGGPTCDSEDVVAREVILPELRCGDRVYILNAGAYSNVCATEFNGFSPPEVHFTCSDAVVHR